MVKPLSKMKSNRVVLQLEEIVRPYQVTFPVTVEGSVNKERYFFPKDELVTLTFPVYEVLKHSSYGKYLS